MKQACPYTRVRTGFKVEVTFFFRMSERRFFKTITASVIKQERMH